MQCSVLRLLWSDLAEVVTTQFQVLQMWAVRQVSKGLRAVPGSVSQALYFRRKKTEQLHKARHTFADGDEIGHRPNREKFLQDVQAGAAAAKFQTLESLEIGWSILIGIVIDLEVHDGERLKRRCCPQIQKLSDG